MPTEYSVNLVKGSNSEMFSVSGVDLAEDTFKSTRFVSEKDLREIFKKNGLTDAQIDIEIQKARSRSVYSLKF
jgi:hypothetical protein